MSTRSDGRTPGQLRPIKLVPEYNKHAEGSTLIECGDTRVICTASVEDKVPHFLRGSGKGWVTSEYGMIPRSTGSRISREAAKGKLSGRTQEIQRLIGRSLRSVVDLTAIKEKTIWLDCDVIQADGGTRTASITGSFVALALALEKLRMKGALIQPTLMDYLGAVSVGIVDGEILLDLNYEEDHAAEVDMNVVMTNQNKFVEIQGTAEQKPFSRQKLDALLSIATQGIHELIEHQQMVLKKTVESLPELFQSELPKKITAPTSNQQ